MNDQNCILSVSTLSGNKVENYEGEEIGMIKDFMIDCYSGKVLYAVLSFGGIFGLGDKLFSIPMPSLYLDKEKKIFKLNMDKETLKNAPGFDKDDWPDMTSKEWSENNNNYYIKSSL